MDSQQTAGETAGNGQTGHENDNPSAEGLGTVHLLAFKGVDSQGLAVGVASAVGEAAGKEGTPEPEAVAVDVEPEIEDVQEEIEAEVIEKPRKYTAKDDKTEIKHAAAVLLAESGMSYGAVAKAIDRHVNTVKNVVPKFKKHSLASPQMAALAKKGVEAVMKGFIGIKQKQGDTVVTVTDKRVKASDMLKAAEMVQARYDPPDTPQQTGNNLFLQLNMGQYNAPNQPK